MKTILFKTTDNWAPFIVRIILALVIFPHGAQKLLGWYGGYGFSGTMEFFTNVVYLPWVIAFLVILIEFFCSLMLLSGFLTRMNALIFLILFSGIIISTHLENGFFMNWYGTKHGEGYEYHLLVLGMSASLLVSGGGIYSTDSFISKYKLNQ